MTLRKKTLLTISLVLLLLFGALHLFLFRFLNKEYLALEQAQLDLNASRVQAIQEFLLESLSIKVTDWSYWDDAYDFVLDVNSRFIESNLQHESLEALGVSVVAFYNDRSELVHAAQIIDQQRTAEVYSEALSQIVPTLKAREGENEKEFRREGIVRAQGQLFSFAARALLSSAQLGPSRGVVVFLKEFGARELQNFSALLKLPLKMAVFGDSSSALEFGAAWEELLVEKRFSERPSEKTAHSFVLLEDVQGAPAAALRVDIPRSIYLQSRQTQSAVYWMMVLATGVFAFVVLSVVELLVLARLSSTSLEITEIARSADASKRVAKKGNDELGQLADNLNQMLSALDSSQREIVVAREAAEVASRAKSAFVANVSHELRTPLNGVIGMTELLRSTKLDETQDELVEIIQSSSVSLQVLINDILEFSKAEAKQIELLAEPFDLRATLAVVSKPLMLIGKQRQIDFFYVVENDVEDVFLGDRFRLSQVLTNLIGNALKFTDVGGVVLLRVECERRAENLASLRFTVLDTGIGIERSKQELIFQAFSQADASTTRKYGGTGLGLTISRDLVRLMGGDLEVRSRPNAGTVFSFLIDLVVLPQMPRLLVPEEVKAQPIEEASLTGLRVLVAEDNEVNQKLIRRILEKLGVNVTIVEDGEQAVTQSALARYDLILMDCQMPVMSGYDAALAIRERELMLSKGGRRIPIIAITANAMDGTAERCAEVGMDDHIFKPFVKDKLVEKLNSWSRK